MRAYDKPIPIPSPESRPYWQGLRKHEFLLPECSDCGHRWFPPSSTCPNCRSLAVAWTKASGKGKIFSFVTFHRSYHPAFSNETPYCVALIQLAEGPRMLSNIVGVEPHQVRCDLDVIVKFDDVTDEVTLAKFEIARDDAQTE